MRVAKCSAGTTAFTASPWDSERGFRLSTSEPLYVVALRPTERAVVVGPREALERVRCEVARRELDGRRDAGRIGERRRADPTSSHAGSGDGDTA